MAHGFSFDFPEPGPSAKPVEYAEAEGDCIQYGIEAIKHIDDLKAACTGCNSRSRCVILTTCHLTPRKQKAGRANAGNPNREKESKCLLVV